MNAMPGKMVTGVWRPPFAEGPGQALECPAGINLQTLASRMEFLPPDFVDQGEISVGGTLIPQNYWRHVRLKAGQVARFHLRLGDGGGGGGNGSGKAVLAIVVAIATVLTAGAAAAGAFSFLGASFAAGGLGATLLSAGISVVGSLIGRALSAPPSPVEPTATPGERERGAASLDANVLAAGGYLPAALGTRLIAPPAISKPLVERIGDDEFVEAVFALGVPHGLGKVSFAGVPAEDADDIEIQTRSGLPGEPPLTLVARYSHTSNQSIELSAHGVNDDAQDELKNQDQPDKSLPVWHRFPIAQCDEFWFDLTMPEGFADGVNQNIAQVVPMRLRIRPLGTDTWFNVPELMYAAAKLRNVKPTIRFQFSEHPPISAKVTTSNEGFVAAYIAVDGQTDINAPSADFAAHGSFVKAGSGGLYDGNEGPSTVTGVHLDGQTADIWLDPAIFPQGRYEAEMKRGAMIPLSWLDKDNHEINGSLVDLFHYQISGSTKVMARSRGDLADRIFVQRTASVVNQHPVNNGEPISGYALIAVRARNRSVQDVKVEAGALMPKWDGNAFTGLGTSSNPGDQMNFILQTDINARPLPPRVFETASFGAFAERCTAQGFTCDLIIEGARVDDVLRRITGCGYARPRRGALWGVITDRDRSNEDNIQVFSPRNSSGLTWQKSFSEVPDAFIVTFRDAADQYRRREITVWRPGREGVANPKFENIEYQGLVYEADIIPRAIYDLRQMTERSVIWTWAAPAESLRCRRGEMIGINHDQVEEEHGSGRLEAIVIANQQMTAMYIDQKVQLFNEARPRDVVSPAASERPLKWGLQSGLEIRRSDGTFSTHLLANETGITNRLVLAAPEEVVPMADGQLPLRKGDLCLVGKPGNVTKRMILVDMDWRNGLTCTLAGVDEAQGLMAA